LREIVEETHHVVYFPTKTQSFTYIW